MINARKEFCDHIAGRKVIAARFTFRIDKTDDEEDDDSDRTVTAVLYVDYTEQEWLEFLAALDFDYNNGYGCQYLFGTIWYDDQTFSKRAEYDGSEWWQHVVRPNPPTRT